MSLGLALGLDSHEGLVDHFAPALWGRPPACHSVPAARERRPCSPPDRRKMVTNLRFDTYLDVSKIARPAVDRTKPRRIDCNRVDRPSLAVIGIQIRHLGHPGCLGQFPVVDFRAEEREFCALTPKAV